MHFPTVALIGRYQDTGLDAPLRALALALRQAGRQLLVDADTARNTGLTEFPAASLEEIGQNASLAVVMGGDGTVLGAARHLAPFGVPLVGINHGRLGFITDIPLQDSQAALARVLEGSLTYASPPSFAVPAGEALICRAVPAQGTGEALHLGL